jgi:membrane protease YdiL (CAAX protease family)
MNDFKHIKDKSPLSNTTVVIMLVTYFVAYFWVIPLIMYAIDDFIMPGFSTNVTVDVILHTSLTLLFLLMGSKLFQESNKHWTKAAFYVPILAAAFMIYGGALLSQAAQALSGQSDSLNQDVLFEMFKTHKASMMVQAIIFAPVVEEIIFRGVIYRHFKRSGRYLIPLIISTLLFATMHSLNAILLQQWADLWYIPVYAFMGLILTFTYEKTQNLYSSIFLHCINNTISIVAMFLMVK